MSLRPEELAASLQDNLQQPTNPEPNANMATPEKKRKRHDNKGKHRQPTVRDEGEDAGEVTPPHAPPSPDDSDIDIAKIKLEAGESPTKKHKSKGPVMDNLYDYIITILVGDNSRPLGIHNGILRAHSTTLAAVLDGDPVEGITLISDPDNDTKALHFHSDDPHIFERINRWFFAKSILLEKGSSGASETYSDLSWGTLIDIYLVAVKYRIFKLQNHCIDATIAKKGIGDKLPNASQLIRLYKSNSEAMPLRQLMLSLFAQGCDLIVAMNSTSQWPSSFLRGLVMELYEMSKDDEGSNEKGKKKDSKKDKKDKKKGGDRQTMWKKRRTWYVGSQKDPISLEDSS